MQVRPVHIIPRVLHQEECERRLMAGPIPSKTLTGMLCSAIAYSRYSRHNLLRVQIDDRAIHHPPSGLSPHACPRMYFTTRSGYWQIPGPLSDKACERCFNATASGTQMPLIVLTWMNAWLFSTNAFWHALYCVYIETMMWRHFFPIKRNTQPWNIQPQIGNIPLYI